MSAGVAQPKSRIGRTVVWSIWGVGVGYLTVVVISAIVRSLFGAPPAMRSDELSSNDRAWCVRQVRGLRDELEAKVKQVVAVPSSAPSAAAAWDGWHGRFTERLEAVAERCAGTPEPRLTTATEHLRELHLSYASAVEAMLNARAEVGASFERDIAALLPKAP